ncbi:hypothetical protein AAT17_12530 [Nonlabens sp. MIC269]|uniref:hypothetical protein n=1 Tax=Nonlabens sp. MIC269 TaxID=1476901 RepID=UPI0007218722|nr:hypothetical protein [Nonlabens sp. MIC269]ALM21998.1 hypothetical protein AAT17_12530 [Nonlabens sp. MIC269]
MSLDAFNKSQVLDYIEKLAIQLFKEKSQFSRADLAYELNAFGISSDSNVIEKLIHELYNSTTKPEVKEALSLVFLNNDLSRGIVDNAKIKQWVSNGQLEKANSFLNEQEKEVRELLLKLSSEITMLVETAGDFVEKKNLVSITTGNYKIERVRQRAESIYQNYKTLLDSYDYAKQKVINLIEDYCIIRNEIIKTYRENVIKLTDVFGPRIKSIEPSLFDFDNLKFYQTDQMIEDIKLEFDSIMQSCGEAMAMINDSISTDLSRATKLIGKGNNSKATLVIAGLAVVKSQLNASKKAAKLSQNVELLKQKMDYDASNIHADLFRLQLVDKKINEIYIPAAHLFQRRFDEIVTQNLEPVFSSLNSSVELNDTFLQKNSLLQEYNELSAQIEDHIKQVAIYNSRIESNSQLLIDYKQLYENALSHSPRKPNLAKKLLSLGAASKTHRRDFGEWYQKYQPIIISYADIQEDIKLDREELETNQSSLQSLKIKLRKCAEKIEKNSLEIYNKIGENSSIQDKISKQLASVINILRIGRTVAEFNIDEEHLTPIEIERINSNVLPDEVTMNLEKFMASLRSDIVNIHDEVSAINNDNSDKEDDLEVMNDNSEDTSSKETKITHTTNEKTAIEKVHSKINESVSREQAVLIEKQVLDIAHLAVDVVEETAKLKMLQLENAISSKRYEQQLETLRAQFKEKVEQVNDRSQVLAQTIRSINSKNQPLHVDSLKELIDVNDQFWITEKEIITALKSGKSITI